MIDSADAFRISFRSDDATQQALSAPGQMRISVEAPEWSGVLVFAIPRGSDGGAVVPVAGAPWNFLSSGDPQAAQGGQLIVDGLSQRDGTGDLAGLLLLPFNYASFSYTEPDAGAGTIRIELVFQPAPPEIPPTPTTEPTVAPPQPANNPCAGLTPADIQRPSLNSKVTACRLRCGPLSGDGQLRACMSGAGGNGGP